MNNNRLTAAYLPEKAAVQEDWDVLLPLVPNIITGTAGDDLLNGTIGKDLVFGYTGNDTIKLNTEGNNADIVFAGSGEDTIYTGSGAVIFAGDDNDAAYITNNSFVDLGAGDDVLQSERFTDGHNIILGGDGNDTISTLHPVDLNNPPDGVSVVPVNDVIYGGEGDDRIDVMGQNFRVKGDAGNDDIMVRLMLLAPSDNGKIDGGDGDDFIFIANNDAYQVVGQEGTHFEIDGGAGNDMIISSSMGGDTLTGGEGNDTFFYEWELVSSADDPDVITDFTFNDQEQDKIDLSKMDDLCAYDYDGKFSNLTFIGYNEFSRQGSEVRLVHTEEGTNVEVIPGTSFYDPVIIQLAGVTQELTQEALIL
ncbi:TPA: hypothetical protein PPN70_004196 [Serratia rubidaea]|nr:hypothetical protein [Serratia rubidaea]HDJ1447355.1 hypothetical protein [Serratia rubidaea]HDJ1460584.1 hypothetical protein [Serratia rubidaea]HDJ2774441.1 hypothetical protein [Serratia rubidaea]